MRSFAHAGPMSALVYGFTMTAIASCAATDDAPARPDGPTVTVAVAPLTLTGIARACYDVRVSNGDGQEVFSRGDFLTSWPVDATTLCSTQFGNGTGGDISYVGPCDADAPSHIVELVVDGFFDDAGNALSDYRNPCPGSTPCKLPVTCEENADTPVTFNLTIMRDADQGFFDIAINFDSIFCSAKVDCTYDAEGTEPIELLFDPVTGERTQTAVVALACTAGPGSDVSTTLLMNDVRVMCGDVDTTLFAGFDVFSCTDDGDEFYGIVQAVTNSTVSFQSAVWTRTPATGAYDAGPVTLTNGAAFGFTDAEALPFLIVDNDDAIGMVGEFGPMIGGVPESAIVNLQPAVFHKVAPATWEIVQLLDHHAARSRDVGLVQESPLDQYFVTRDGFEIQDPGIQFFLYPRTGDGDWTYGEPIHLARPAEFETCVHADAFGSAYIVMGCTDVNTGDVSLLAWDVDASPSSVPSGLYLDAEVMPLVAADFNLTHAQNGAITVNSINDFWGLGSVVGVGAAAAPDRIFATASLDLSDGVQSNYAYNTIVHFERVGGAWQKAPVPFGADTLPFLGAPFSVDYNYGYTDIETVLDTAQTDAEVVTGGAYFGVQYQRFVAIYDRASNTWDRHYRWEYDAGLGQTALVDASPRIILRDTPGATFVVGVGRISFGDPYRAWIVPLGDDPEAPAPVSFLPMPAGFTLDRVDGIRGATDGPEVRVSGRVVDGANNLRAIEWRWTRNAVGGGFTLANWYVMGPTGGLAYLPYEYDLDDRSRTSSEQSPIYDLASPRCTQFIDRYFLPNSPSVFEHAAFIVDVVEDVEPLDAVSQRQPLGDVSGGMEGVLIERDPVAEPSALLPTADPSAVALLDPALTSEGNAWSSASPKPDDIPDHVLQMASYHGEESLLCGSEPCNKLFWNTAIAFDPTMPDCMLAFEATAANTASLVGGQLPPNTAWPIIIGRVPLTGPADADGGVALACTQHPLNSDALFTLYKPPEFDWDLCYSYGASGASPTMTDLDCGYDAAAYLQFDAMTAEEGQAGP